MLSVTAIGNICIYTAGILWGIELIPQLVKTYKTKNVKGISLSFFSMCLLAYTLYAIGNYFLGNWNILISHAPSLVLNLWMVILIIRYRGKEMKRQKVNSSNITSVGYNKQEEILEVEFNTGSIYHYKNVKKQMVENFLNSDSIGRFFNLIIRKQYKHTKGEWKEQGVMPNFYICGKAGAGKTYAAKYLMEKCGYIQAKFAFPVYGIAYDYFDMDKKDRLLLQTIGTECAREAVNKDIWVNRFAEDTRIVQLARERLGLPVAGLVCDDCRFPNEHAVLKASGWVGIYLDVSDEIRIARLGKRDGNAQVTTLEHSSELGINEFKDELIKIDSSKTLEYTYRQLDALLDSLNQKV